MRWIRLNIDFDNSSWLFPLSAAAQMAWIKLLCHVKRDGIKGRCKALSPQEAAARFGVTLPDVEQMLNAAAEDQALAVEDGYWTLTGWTEYQEADARGTNHKRKLDFWEAEPETIFVEGRGQEIDAETYAQNRRHCGTALRRRLYWIRRGEKTREPFTEEAWHDQRRPA